MWKPGGIGRGIRKLAPLGVVVVEKATVETVVALFWAFAGLNRLI